MHIEWSSLVLLAAEFTFAVLFLRALTVWLRRRDPLQRDVTLVFLPCTVIFVVDIARRIHDGVPMWVSMAATTILLIQPYLTVRLAARLRTVPPWLDRLMLLAYFAIAVPLVLAPRPLHTDALAAMTVTFSLSELVAVALLYGKARTRAGANRARLMIAALATLAAAGMIVFIGLSALAGVGPYLQTISRILALISGLGYLVAFMPTRTLRRIFAASAAQHVTERLLRAPVDSPGEVWQTYAGIMREQTGADAVAVFMPTEEGHLVQTAYAGPPLATPENLTAADLTALIRQGRPARLREGDPALVAHYSDDLSDDFVIVLSMPVPPDVEGAVLLIHRHRTLFSDDDLRLLAALGGQAAVLAERQAVIETQRGLVDALTRAGQAKTAFLANMSHELRTPLNAIIGFSDLMRMEEPDGDRRRVPAEWVDHIHTSGRHLLGLINDILDLAKVEAGRLELRPAPLRLDTAIEELLTGLEPLFTTKHLTVVRDVRPVTAPADRVRFRQIVENLLSNAIKFTPEGGSVTVTVRRAGDRAYVSVTDTGVGIAPADHPRVFEEFQQVGDPDKQRAGTGLGLALTKRLVEAHDGEITLTSAPGRGSTFTVGLPAAPATRSEPGEGPYVLLIEDDQASAELMRTQLSAAGYRVEVAGDGSTGLAIAADHRPDAVVLDVALPDIDGWEVIRRLKENEDLAGVPVFFATIVDDPQAGLSLGARDYFVKPVDQTRLLSALAGAVSGHAMPRVLVVDHDDVVRQAIEDGLRAGGADVVACATGRDGMARSRSGDFDLIVCDMQTPDVDGFSLLAAIEQDPAARQTAVLGLSSAQAAPPVATAMAGGVAAAAMSNASLVAGRTPEEPATPPGDPATRPAAAPSRKADE